MKLFYSNQQGRSMIEMLGVLAIVGVLSVGGIAGYSKAMANYRINKLIEDYSFFINGLIANTDIILKANEYHIAPALSGLGIIPDRWKLKGAIIYDNENRELFPFVVDSITLDYRFKAAKTKNVDKDIQLLCQKLWLNIVKPYADSIYTAALFRGETQPSSYYWGSQYCNISKPCLSILTLPKITELCSSCLEDTRCSIEIKFK
ncbi:MAG: hypothetical protein NC218_10415 [Acetobacter sp.]|nr:hypothetical protein [Acetobacter sp.]